MKACVANTRYFGQMLKMIFGKILASFWATNETVKIRLLNDRVCYITHEVNLLALTHEDQLVRTDRNK